MASDDLQQDPAQRKTIEKATAQAITNLTGATPQSLATSLQSFAAAQQARVVSNVTAAPRPASIFEVNTAQFDPQPLTLGQDANAAGSGGVPPGNEAAQPSGSTVVTQIGPDGSGNYTWQVDDIDIFSSFDRNGGDLTGLITNLSTPITLSHTADTILYGEASFNTSAPTSPPTVTSITFKTGTALPAGGNLEYINVGTSPKVNNVQSICRFTIAESTVTAGVPKILICTPGTVWGKTFGTDAQLSGGGTPFIVNCVCLGDP